MADLKRGLIRLNPDREPPRRRVLAAGAVVAGAGAIGPAASGAVTPRRPDQQDMPAPRGLGGGFRGNLFKARLVIIFGPTGEPLGVFVYQAGTTPALGNPPVTWLTSGTVDPFGNVLPSAQFGSLDLATGRFTDINGSVISFSSQNAGTFIQRAAQIFMGDALLTTINPELIIDAPAANGGLPNARIILFGPSRTGGAPLQQILACLSSTSTPATAAFFEVQGTQSLKASSAPTAVAGYGFVYANSNGTLATVLPSGLGGTLAVTQTDTSTNPNPNTATQPLTTAWTINAADAKVGTTYEVEVPFNGVFENQSLAFPPSLNGATVATSGGDTLGGAFFSLGQGFAGLVKLKVQILTTGAGGTANFFIDGGVGINGNRSSGTNNNNAYLSSQATGVAFNTTVSNTIAVNSVWGGSTAGQTVTGHGSDFTRKGP